MNLTGDTGQVGGSGMADALPARFSSPESIEFFKAVVQSSDDAIIGKTMAGIVTSWNPGAEVMFGYSANEMIGSTLNVLLPPERLAEESSISERLKGGENIQHVETVRIRKDGRRIKVCVNCSPIRDAGGNIVGVSKIVRDMAFDNRHIERLQLTASAFENLNDGIVITDANGVIIESNEAISSIFGYAREEVIGHNPLMFQASGPGAEIVESVREALKKNGFYRGETWGRRRDGSHFAGLVTINTVKSGTGEILHYVALCSDITPLLKKQEQLEHLAHFDALTDLPNRILLADRLHQAMSLCLRARQSLAVLYLDLDYFKEINDTYGHDIGDKLLVAVSQRMRDAMRDADTLARIGGDELVAVLLNVGSTAECSRMAERILRACAEPILVDGKLLQVSASIGITIFPQDNADADQLLRHADRAMYEAKQAGKNRVYLFDSRFEREVEVRKPRIGDRRRQ